MRIRMFVLIALVMSATIAWSASIVELARREKERQQAVQKAQKEHKPVPLSALQPPLQKQKAKVTADAEANDGKGNTIQTPEGVKDYGDRKNIHTEQVRSVVQEERRSYDEASSNSPDPH